MENIIIIDLEQTGKNIKKLMDHCEVSAKDISTSLGLSGPQAVYRWIHGEALPKVDHLVMLTRLLKVSYIDDILIVKEIKISEAPN